MCGIWSDSDDHLTTDPRTFLYSILYSKKAAVEAYTPPTHCPTALYLYSSYTAAIQQLYRLYSYTAIQQLYSIHPLQHPCALSRQHWRSVDGLADAERGVEHAQVMLGLRVARDHVLLDHRVAQLKRLCTQGGRRHAGKRLRR